MKGEIWIRRGGNRKGEGENSQSKRKNKQMNATNPATYGTNIDATKRKRQI